MKDTGNTKGTFKMMRELPDAGLSLSLLHTEQQGFKLATNSKNINRGVDSSVLQGEVCHTSELKVEGEPLPADFLHVKLSISCLQKE